MGVVLILFAFVQAVYIIYTIYYAITEEDSFLYTDVMENLHKEITLGTSIGLVAFVVLNMPWYILIFPFWAVGKIVYNYRLRRKAEEENEGDNNEN